MSDLELEKFAANEVEPDAPVRISPDHYVMDGRDFVRFIGPPYNASRFFSLLSGIAGHFRQTSGEEAGVRVAKLSQALLSMLAENVNTSSELPDDIEERIESHGLSNPDNAAQCLTNGSGLIQILLQLNGAADFCSNSMWSGGDPQPELGQECLDVAQLILDSYSPEGDVSPK